jgi:hypothetical protein
MTKKGSHLILTTEESHINRFIANSENMTLLSLSYDFRNNNKGRRFSEIHKKRIADSQRNEKGHNWKGNLVGNNGLHAWIKRYKIKPNSCEKCNTLTNRLDCCNISGVYKRDINDFKWLCRRCHMNEDGRLDKLKQNKRRIYELRLLKKDK